MSRTADVDPAVFAHSAAAERNRRRKAVALAVVVRARDVDVVPDDRKARRALLNAAGVKTASDETWRQAMRAARWQDWVETLGLPGAPPWLDCWG